jgi:sulfide:quinone oxidoreductase
VVVTASGRELPYDTVVVATGGRRRPALPGALTFGLAGAIQEFEELLAALEDGSAQRVVFAVPRGVAWALPLYELALLTSTYLAANGIRGAELSLVTAERAPLSMFGAPSSNRVAALLREAGIVLRTVGPRRIEDGELVLATGERLDVDRVVSLPYLNPPEIVGLPSTANGLIPVDRHGRVAGLKDVYAAGDATAYPINQGGLAAQQADAVARSIAASVGAPVARRGFRPVLRGALLTGQGVEYMRHRPGGGDAALSDSALWWPATKIAAGYLGPVLAGEAAEGLSQMLCDVGDWHRTAEQGALSMALEAADADAGWGDFAGALRWLGVAEQLAIVLPPAYARKRNEWREARAGVPVS